MRVSTRNWKMFYFVLILVPAFFFTGCLNMSEIDTPHAKGLFAMKTFMKTEAEYKGWCALTDLTASEVKVLDIRRDLLLTSADAIIMYNGFVETGRIPTAAVERRMLDYLRQIERNAIRDIGRKSVESPKTDDEIIKDLRAAGLISAADEKSAQSKSLSPSLIYALIELVKIGIQSTASVFEMKGMTPEEIMAEWILQWGTFKVYDPDSLPVPNIGAG